MTETCSPGTGHPPVGPDKPGSIGLMLPGIELDVVALDNPKQTLPPGDVGEIRIKGPNVTRGYWNRPQETAEAFVGDRFLTGDIGYMIVMEALGRALVLEPYLATVVLGGGFLRRGGSAAQKAAYIPGIIDGSKTLAFAQLEKNSRYDLGDVSTTAKKKGDGWVIDGEKFVVLNGEAADTLVVTARTKGAQTDGNGIGVFLVPRDAKGVAVKGYPTQDGMHAADITFTGVEVGADAAIGDPENGLPLIEQVVDDARIAMCAEAVGAMEESLKITVEYLKTRKQFGVPIGSFQTLQHRAADMFVNLEQARSMSAATRTRKLKGWGLAVKGLLASDPGEG